MKNKKTKIAIIGIIALVLVTIGITYAYWLITRTQEGENVITTGCLNITLEGENNITLSNQFPISDAEGMELTPYTFTVTNNCNTNVDYQINLAQGYVGNSISDTSLKIALDNDISLLSSKLKEGVTADEEYIYLERYIVGYGSLGAKDSDTASKTHTFRIWLDENAPLSEMTEIEENPKVFRGSIEVVAGHNIVNPLKEGTLAYTLFNTAKTSNQLYTTTPDFSVAATDAATGVYSIEDDLGMSYYFRGNVTNNIVKFGSWKVDSKSDIMGCYGSVAESCTAGPYETVEACEADFDSKGTYRCEDGTFATAGNDMYWRIVRINGDGTIRLAYFGVSKSLASYAPISRSLYDDSSANYTDSTVKGILESWYATNLEADYGKYVDDEVFCNDKSDTNADGNYDSYDRIMANNPSLKCTNTTDRYSVSAAKGNGLLSKPVGLLTADELMLSGMVTAQENYDTRSYLQHFSENILTMSPYQSGKIMNKAGSGPYYISYENVTESMGVVPVINLKADVQFTGSGTTDSPYEIVAE